MAGFGTGTGHARCGEARECGRATGARPVSNEGPRGQGLRPARDGPPSGDEHRIRMDSERLCGAGLWRSLAPEVEPGTRGYTRRQSSHRARSRSSARSQPGRREESRRPAVLGTGGIQGTVNPGADDSALVGVEAGALHVTCRPVASTGRILPPPWRRVQAFLQSPVKCITFRLSAVQKTVDQNRSP